ncbi:YicC/YloC family endoribonuclease [Peribacillus tepidiphilus]|uniref:YicC/YloC family endoribonuclease n=1 Tax=Peribacillus tepidiphilus TaxID=2652445 RepID=UPI001290BCFB|nr:YicC/YloC family endoribonuclease [Peribacillus tepidiphilus]
MVVSMTGFGRSSIGNGQINVNVEIKTVNHRFTEFYFRMPRQLLVLEEKIKKTMSEYFRRGRAEIFVTVDGDGLINRKLQLDWNLLDQFFSEMEKVKEKYGLDDKPSIGDIVHIENIFTVEEEHTDSSELEEVVLDAVRNAALQVKKMRMEEGQVLKADLEEQLKKISTIVEYVKEFAPNVIEAYKQRLQQKMNEYTSGLVDETRLLNEVAIFADKVDINEELTRLQSHIRQFAKTLEDEGLIGRKLDFLVQEMNREVNTIGSKANDATIAGSVVEMKSSLEKMKEQVQNIE